VLYETFNEGFSVLRERITLRNWSYVIVCKQEKFVDEPLDGRSAPIHFALCRQLNTAANSFVMAQDYSTEEELALKFQFVLPKEATAVLSKFCYMASYLRKSNFNFHCRDNHSFPSL
jgi:hypothetical protein